MNQAGVLNTDMVSVLLDHSSVIIYDMEATQLTIKMQELNAALTTLTAHNKLLRDVQEKRASVEDIKKFIEDFNPEFEMSLEEYGVFIKIDESNMFLRTIAKGINAIIRVILVIIDFLVDLWKRIFSRRYHMLRQLLSYKEHFTKGWNVHNLVDAQLKDVIPYSILYTWFDTMNAASHQISKLFNLFELTGCLDYNAVDEDGALTILKNTKLFEFSRDDNNDLIVSPEPQKIVSAKTSGTPADLGWDRNAILNMIDFLNVHLSQADRYAKDKKSLKKMYIDKIHDRITDEVSERRYTAGIQALNNLSCGHSVMTTTLIQELLIVCGAMKRLTV